MGISTTEDSTTVKSTAPTAQLSQSSTPLSPNNLPDTPLVTIEANKAWNASELHDLWAYRELLYFLMWRDVKVRYKQTELGIAWAIIQPLLTMLIFTLFFGRLAGVPSDNVPYPIFAYAGLLPWTFFANAIGNSGNSLVKPHHQGLFPSNDHSRSRSGGRAGGFCDWVCHSGGADVLLRRRNWLGSSDVFAALAIDDFARNRNGHVVVGTERQISRRPFRSAFPDSTLDVCVAGYLSGELLAVAVSLAALV